MDKDLKDGGSRIPRELVKTEQTERLTNKHIQTLGFLQEIANENKVLKEQVKELEETLEGCKDIHAFAENSKAKIQEIQESYMAKADEVNLMLAEKYRMEVMQVQEEKFEIERELKEQILKMRHDIENLQASNKDMRDIAQEEEEENKVKKQLKEVVKQNKQYQEEMEELKEEVESLRSDLEVIQSKKATDMGQIRDLHTANKKLEQFLQEEKQKNTELAYQLERAKSELKETAQNQEQTDLIENLRDKVRQLSSERESAGQLEFQMRQDILDLQSLLDEMGKANHDLQRKIEKVLMEYGHLTLDYEKLRKRSMKEKDNKTFKDFITLKRELRSLKYENEELKSKTKPDAQVFLTAEPLPQIAMQPRKKLPIEGPRNGGKKMLALT